MSLPPALAGSGLRADTERTRPARPLISLVIPVFNEAGALAPFLAAVNRALPPERHDLQFVFVNDGSRDATLAGLAGLARDDQRLVIVDLSRNFGKEAALTAGLAHAAGDVVIPIDVDLQDPPEVIPRLLEKWTQGFDVVLARRASRLSDGPVKRLSAQGFYRVFNAITAVPIPVDTGDFRLMDRTVIQALERLGERNRFMKGLFAWAGFNTATVDYVRPRRETGQSSWSLIRLWNFALDGIVSFSTLPLKVSSYLGAFIALLALAYAAVIAFRTLVFGVDVPGYASLMVVILTLGGIQLISIGVMGEYIGRAFLEAKQRPIYLVSGVYRHPTAPAPRLTSEL